MQTFEFELVKKNNLRTISYYSFFFKNYFLQVVLKQKYYIIFLIFWQMPSTHSPTRMRLFAAYRLRNAALIYRRRKTPVPLSWVNCRELRAQFWSFKMYET